VLHENPGRQLAIPVPKIVMHCDEQRGNALHN